MLPIALVVVSAALAALPVEERALAALAGGDAKGAALLLRGSTEPGLLCLEGEAWRRAGSAAAARAAWSKVPADAACAATAAFGLADLRIAAGDRGGAEEWARLARERLGEGRGDRLAAALEGRIDVAMADPNAGRAQVLFVTERALGLPLSAPQRMRLAVAAVQRREEVGGVSSGVAAVLLQAFTLQGAEAELRRLLALAGRGGLRGLAPAGAGVDLDAARAEVAEDAATSAWWLQQVLAGGGAAPPAAKRTLLWQVDRGYLPPAGLLADDSDIAAATILQVARLGPAGAAQLDEWLVHWPGARAWADVAAARDSLWIEAAHQAFADKDLNAAEAALQRRLDGEPDGVDHARWLLGRLQWERGQTSEAVATWEALAASAPYSVGGARAVQSLARSRLASAGGLDAALAWLREHPEAAAEQERMQAPDLQVSVAGPQAPNQAVVQVVARNVASVEVRVHRIDAEAVLRAGGSLSGLPDLDVAAIAPDRRFDVPVPGYAPGLDIQFDLPVPQLGPGLWAVGVAGTERVGTVFVLVSDLAATARAVGDQIVVGASRGGKAERGVVVQVREGGSIQSCKTDGDGVCRVPSTGGAASVLLSDRRGLAWVELDRGTVDKAEEPPVLATMRLDRPRYLPGQPVSVVVVGSRAGAPYTGEWALWLDGQELAPVRAKASADGVVSAALDGLPVAGGRVSVPIWGQVPGEEEPIHLGQASFAPPQGDGLRLRLLPDQAQVRVDQPDGRPAAGVAVEWRWQDSGRSGTGMTDAQGLLSVPAVPAGLDDALVARLAGVGDFQTVATTAVEQLPPQLSARVEGAEAVAEVKAQPGRVLVELLALRLPPTAAEPPADPWVPTLPQGMAGPLSWPGEVPASPAPVRERVASQVVDGGGVVRWKLPPGGHFEVRAHNLDVDSDEAVVPLSPAASLDLVAPEWVAVGGRLRVSAAAGTGLLTVEGGRLLGARMVAKGGTVDVTVPPDAGDTLHVLLQTPEGQVVQRTVEVRRQPTVTMQTRVEGERLVVDVQALGADGLPVQGDLILTVLDADRRDSLGGVVALDTDAWHRQMAGNETAGAASGSYQHGVVAEPLSGALLDEARRVREAQSAQAAASGTLMNNSAWQMMESEDMPAPRAARGEAMGMGSLGSSGYGSGGGSGSGYGKVGKWHGGEPQVRGTGASLLLRARTGTDGRWSGTVAFDVPGGVAAPAGSARWAVEAQVVARAQVGGAKVDLERFGALRAPPAEAWGNDGVAVVDTASAVARAGRVALAQLPRATAADRDRLVRRVGMLRAALPAARGEADAIEALLFLGEARAVLGLSRPELDAAAARVPGTPRAEIERIRALRARLVAGLDVDPLLLDRLVEATLDPLQAEEAALTLLAAGRRDAARLRAPGGLAAHLAGGPRPTVAVAGRWEAEATGAGLAVADAAKAEPGPLVLVRLPRGVDGRPVVAGVDALTPCGDPCRVQVGDGIAVAGLRDAQGWLQAVGWADVPGASGGLVAWLPQHSGDEVPFLLARAAGEATVPALLTLDPDDGPQALYAQVIVGEASDPASPAAEDLLLAQHVAGGPVRAADLDRWPDLPSASPDVRASRAQGRFALARALGDPAVLVEAFAQLRERSPTAVLQFDDVVAVAEAHQAVGRHERALVLWKAALGLAWREQVAATVELEEQIGVLSSLQITRNQALNLPTLPEVGATLFHLPARLDGLPLDDGLTARGLTATDLKLTAAAWDRSFLAWYPANVHAPEVGFHLARTLFGLNATDEAANWARRVADLHPDSPVRDGLVYVEALARLEGGQDGPASRLLEQLSTDSFPLEDGTTGPALSREDARLALGRLAEAQGRIDDAVALYEEVAAGRPEASRARAALQLRSLTAPPVLRLGPSEAVAIPVTARNIPSVELRAYALDLRTLFLRDGGVPTDVQVDGVRPAWSGKQRLGAGAWPDERDLSLPLSGSGVWWVRAEADDNRAGVLVVRSALSLTVDDLAGVRRVVVRRGGQPARGVAVRALVGGQVIAATTDRAGTVEVPMYAAVLAWDGEDVAFTDRPTTPMHGQGYAPSPAAPDSLNRVDQRLQKQRAKNDAVFQDSYEYGGLEAGML